MGITVKKVTAGGQIPVFQKILEMAPGGFTLDVSALTDGVEVPAGSVMGFDEEEGKASVLKTAKVYEAATNTATEIKVEKGHPFVDGEFVAAVLEGAAYDISVDTSNDDYDVITVSATLGVALSVGDALFESAESGAAVAEFMVEPKGLSQRSVIAGTNETIGVVTRGTAYERRIPVIPDGVKELIPNMLFSQSY